MTIEEIIALVAHTMRKSSLPSANGLHQPNRYQASVHANDMAQALEKAGLIDDWFTFYEVAMPKPDCTETWNDLHSSEPKPL